MDQQKIGAFISKLRKEKGLTQRQIADKLSISEKTVSKWECGNGLPEVSLMMPLCEILGITVNELLSGEKIAKEDYKKVAEHKLLESVERQNFNNKKSLVASFMIGIFCTLILTMAIIIAGYLPERVEVKIVVLVLAIVLFILGLGMAIMLDIQVGYFECPHCHHRYQPTFGAYIWGAHTIKRRFLKCPKCGKRGWHKHEYKVSDK